MILPSQSSLFNGASHLPHGIYDDLLGDVSTAPHDNEGGFFKHRRTRRKAWVFFGVYSPELICGIAIADAGFVANAFTYFYSFKDNVFAQDNALVPLGFGAGFDPHLHTDWRLGQYSISTNDQMQLQYQGKFDLKISARNNAYGASIVAPSKGGRPFNFTYKNVCLPVEVSIQHAGKTYTVTGNYGAIDFTKGYPPRETYWNWLAFIGQTESGKQVGINLVKHFNGDMENVLWVDTKKIVLSPGHFDMQKPIDKSPWHITTNDDILDCTLVPNGARSENVNALVLKSIFTQTYGKITGTLLLDGQKEAFTAYGVGEDHHALW